MHGLSATGASARRNGLLAAAGLLAAVLALLVSLRAAHADGTFSLSSNAYTVNEGDAVTITINRSGGTQNVQINITVTAGSAGAGSDYFDPGTSSYIFTVPGSNTFSFPISTNDDTANEVNETFSVTISVPPGSSVGTASATVTIVDDDGSGTVQFAQGTYTVNEGAGTASIGVTRTNGSTGAASVQCSTVSGGTATAGSDYTTVTNQVLNWSSGETATKFCTVPILQDTLVEGPETVSLQLSNPTGGAALGTPSTATLTILDDDGTGIIQFTSATYTGTEAGGAITITVSRTGGSTGAVTVDYASVTGGTATAGVDYTAVSGTLSWANGETGNKSFTVTPIPDTVTEGSETVILQLSNPTGGATLGTPSTATLTITDSTIIPVITSISPGAGPTSGGTTVTITGLNFSGATSVTFDGLPCTSLTVVSSTTITCVTPAHAAGTVEVVVTTPLGSNVTTGTANDFVYTTGPIVTSLSPTEGNCNGATIVTITGTGFTSSGMTVAFGSVSATFTYISSTQVVAVAPVQGAGTVDVRVTTPGGTSPNTAADDFTCTGTPVPTVTSVSPASGAAGTTVTITGTNFTGVTSVTFGGVAASFTVVSSTQITATVPTGVAAGVVDVRVTNAAGTSANTPGDNFRVTSSGTITYTLHRTFTLIVWTGADNKPISQAIGGTQQGTTNVSGLVGAIWLFDPLAQQWRGYFPGSEGVPGANDFTTFRSGTAYFIALRATAPRQVTWNAPAN